MDPMSEKANSSAMIPAKIKLKNRETITPGRGKMACMPWRERTAELANPKAASIEKAIAAIGLSRPAYRFRSRSL